MPVTGHGKMKILIIAEAPGEQEDQQGIQLIGPAGQVLRGALAEFGIDLDNDCRKTNAVRCRPPANRKPSRMEIVSCQSHIWEEIKKNPPKVIILLGQVAVESFFSGRSSKSPGAIGRWRGFIIPDQKAGAWVCPTFHPSYILRSREGRRIRGKEDPDMAVEERIFIADIEKALTHLHKPFLVAPVPKIFIDGPVHVQKASFISIDYETTGLRPWQKKEHRIVSFGICWRDGVLSRPMEGNNIDDLKRILSDPSIKKVGHNIKFEQTWATHCLGVETQGWVWDTMLAAHMVDNRRRICKLKHQIYLNFGVEDWTGKNSFGEDDDEDDSDGLVNQGPPSPELLRYNALDAFWTYQLATKQMELFK